MGKLIGDVKDYFLLQNLGLDISSTLEGIMDDAGLKIANVFF